jgi:nucleotide-binding universal stress UspA family protein
MSARDAPDALTGAVPRAKPIDHQIGARALYGARPTHAVAAVLVYLAISLWIPLLGGLIRLHAPASTARRRNNDRNRQDSIVSAANGSIVIAYDGSENARHAISVAARELGPGPAEVVYVWEPLARATSRLAMFGAAFSAAVAWEEIEAEQERARATAEEGARIASAAGFDDKATVLPCAGPPADELVDYIEQRAPHVHVPILIVPPDARTDRHERTRPPGQRSPGRSRGSKRSAITLETA